MSADVTSGTSATSGCLALIFFAFGLACAKAPPSGDARLAPALGAKPKRSQERPEILITVELPGAGALAVEQQLLAPIEHAISAVSALDEIEGRATPGRALLRVRFAVGTDPYTAMTALRDAMPLTTFPSDASHPVIERSDPAAGLMFVLLAPDTPGDAVGPGEHEAMETLGNAVAQQPGITAVRQCGWARPVLVVDLDPAKLSATGLTLDAVVESIEPEISVGLREVGIDAMLAASIKPIDGVTRLRDAAALRVESREGPCTVLGSIGRAHPALQVWGTPEAIANAQALVDAAPLASRVRTWRLGDPSTALARVASTRPPDEARIAMQHWLASDGHEPAWLVQDHTDPAWLLAAGNPALLSLGHSAGEEIHVWSPAAPLPLQLRICGPELESLIHVTEALAAALRSEARLEHIATWVPRYTPQAVFTIDREAAARHGIPSSALSRWAPLFTGGELALGSHVVLHVDGSPSASVPLRGASGSVASTALGTVRVESEPTFIAHVDRRRCTAVDVQHARVEDRGRIEALLPTIALPVGVSVTIVQP